MQRDFFRRRWYLCAALSGILLILSFYPFYLWPLCFVALVPVSIAAIALGGDRKKIFAAGGIALGMLSFTLWFFLVVQFNWLPASPLFMHIIRYGGIAAATLGYGSLFGLWLLLYSALRSRSLLINTLVGGSLYVLAERIAEFSVGGYYLGTFAHAVTALPFLMSLASVGGASLVSFIVVLVNLYIAEVIMSRQEVRREVWHSGGIVIMSLGCIFIANTLYLHSGQQAPQQLFSVASIQVASPREKVFASINDAGALSFPWLENALKGVAQGNPDLIIYPDSPVQGIVARDASSLTLGQDLVATQESQLQGWIAQHTPQDATLMTWEDVSEHGAITTQFQFWKNGKLEGEIVKNALMPFMDFEPAWARKIQLYSMPFDVVPGLAGATSVKVGNVAVGGLVCSEVQHETRARVEASDSQIIIAAGSEAMFQDDGVGLFSVHAAQYRAVENNLPIIRASLLGPSAIIDRTGKILAYMPLGTGGVLGASVSVEQGKHTLFSMWGEIPLWLLIAISIATAVYFRFLGRKEQG